MDKITEAKKQVKLRNWQMMYSEYKASGQTVRLYLLNYNFEKLIRFYGDGIGKGRGNVNLSLHNEFKPMSMCAVTGELLDGTALRF